MELALERVGAGDRNSRENELLYAVLESTVLQTGDADGFAVLLLDAPSFPVVQPEWFTPI